MKKQRWESGEARLLEFIRQRTREERDTQGECQRSRVTTLKMQLIGNQYMHVAGERTV